MTFDEVYKEYMSQYEREIVEYQAYKNKLFDRPVSNWPKYTGFQINYSQIDSMLLQAAHDEFGFTPAEAATIFEAYDRYHSSYADMPYGMRELCKFIVRFHMSSQ